jgi:Ni/Fe-hydrogenase subunit HybB-like protein
MLLSAVAAGLHARFIGYDRAYNTYREVPWGILIATYVFFVVTSTGLCLVSSIGHVFGKKEFMPMAKRAVYLSILTICAGFLVLAFEIENPVRMAIYNVISPNMTSNIWWMGTLYGAYLFFMVLEFTFILLNKYKKATLFGLMGVVAGVAAHSNLGAVFGMLHGREFWYGPFIPIYFIASAMMSGCAAIIFFTWLAYRMNGRDKDQPMLDSMAATKKLAILMIFVMLFLEIWKIIAGSVSTPNETAALGAIVSGPYSFNFWGMEVACGMVIPLMLFLTAKSGSLNRMFLASMLMIVGIYFMRYDLVIVGQIVPVYFELGVNAYSHLLSYTPSTHEIMVVMGGIGFVGFNFLLGEKIFDGHKVEQH